MLLKPLKDAPPIIKVGEPFKSLVTGKIHTPMWNDDNLWWIVTPDSNYGYLGPIDPWQKYAAPTRAAAAKSENKDGWKVDDRLMFSQGRMNLSVVATAEKCVLMQPDGKSRPMIETNDGMGKFYTKMKALVKLF